MTSKKIIIEAGAVLVLVTLAYFAGFFSKPVDGTDLDPTPRNVTLSGTYVCLPHVDTSGPQTEECAFGLKTDGGLYYAVNFGASASAMEQFQSGAHITADGFVVIREALSSDHWAKYDMEGIFTITKMIDPASVQGKINIDVVCEQALTYMSFPDAKSAEVFVAECKEGKYPEVIEQYKASLNLGEDVAI
ncbi:MAG: hypothetical protein RJA61_416 [Candidatus Parcubacteria bacterium]|jgi:hypothetical protein